MKSVIIYDSLYGNTEMVAKTIGKELGGSVILIKDFRDDDIYNADILIVGSPVHGGHPTTEIEEFIKSLPNNSLKGKKVAAFDTRFEVDAHGIGLKLLMRITRFAAEKIAKDLEQKGGILVVPPVGFIVEDKKGPLKKGEIERVKNWTKEVNNYV